MAGGKNIRRQQVERKRFHYPFVSEQNERNISEMTTLQSIFTIAAVAAGTVLTRFLPFLIFPEGKTPPKYITWLGTVLPHAVIGLLVVYCLKDAVFSVSHGLPELIAMGFIFILHRWKKNTLLSIAGGTVFYMFLVQNFF